MLAIYVYRYWTEWSQFYPVLGADDNTENLGYVDPVEKERQERAKAAALPKMVLVEVADVRMFYPTCYVAVVGSEDNLLLSQQNVRIFFDIDQFLFGE